MSRPESRPRIVSLTGWCWEADADRHVAPESVERLLARAKSEGLVREYDVGRGVVWFNAPAGATARALRDQVGALLPEWKRVANQ